MSEANIKVRIPTQLRSLSAGQGEVTLKGSTVAEVLKELDSNFTGFSERLFDETGQLRRFVNIFLNDEDVRFLSGLDTPVEPGQTLSIVPAVAGG